MAAANRNSSYPRPQLPPCNLCGRQREPVSVPGTYGDQWLCPVCGPEGFREEVLAELNRHARTYVAMDGSKMRSVYG